jgi:hypothetical protein
MQGLKKILRFQDDEKRSKDGNMSPEYLALNPSLAIGISCE